MTFYVFPPCEDNFDDNGWGCAYRSLQTCVSWYRMQHYSTEGVPSIPEIQRLLKCIDEAHKDLEIGSKKWFFGEILVSYSLAHTCLFAFAS